MGGFGAFLRRDVDNHDDFVGVGFVDAREAATRQLAAAKSASDASAHGGLRNGMGWQRSYTSVVRAALTRRLPPCSDYAIQDVFG
jgi:hypothetical protein